MPTTNFPGGFTANATNAPAAAIANASVAVAAPTKAEFDAVVAKLNAVLVVLRDNGLLTP